jgi:YebC/PmpR family DNA-binding regulatory protein
MSGHSKWANIKRRKAAQDSKKAKVFTKIIKEITIAAKEGGGDPNANPRLRTLLEKGRHENMPIDNINRAIKKGTGELPGVSYEAHIYEGYGPSGIAVILEVLTENKNRSIAETRRVFNIRGGNIAETGAVNWMFERLAVINLPSQDNLSEDKLLELLLEFDIKNIELEDRNYTVTCAINQLELVKAVLTKNNFKIESAELEWVPKSTMALEGEAAEKAVEFLEELDELEDVQNVYTNLG